MVEAPLIKATTGTTSGLLAALVVTVMFATVMPLHNPAVFRVTKYVVCVPEIVAPLSVTQLSEVVAVAL